MLHEHELVYSLHVLQTRLSQVYLAYRLAVYAVYSVAVAVAGTFVARVMDANQHLLLRISASMHLVHFVCTLCDQGV